MTLKAELETWAEALKAYDEENFEQSIDLFTRIADTSKILTNVGLIYATLGEHEVAVEKFQEAVALDQYLAVAYFQCGVSNFLLGRYELALKDFEEALLYLRGNQAINYEQLGLKFLLYSAEVLFNKGLAQIYLGQVQPGLADMEEARREKATEEHNVIDDAIADRGDGYTVFSIPVGVLYRPAEKKLKNAGTRDYMGKAKLIAAEGQSTAYATFEGATQLARGVAPNGTYADRPPPTESIGRSFSATAALPKRTADTGNAPTRTRSATAADVGGARPLARANTTLTTAKPSANAMIGGPGATRALSVRRPGAPAAADTSRGPSPRVKDAPGGAGSRMTEFYDDYLDSYTEEPAGPPPPVPKQPGSAGGNPPPAGTERIAAWARSNATPQRGAGSAGGGTMRSAPPSQYAPSSYGGGSVRRKVTRRRGPTSSRSMSMYEEEEEGYGSGEYEDGPFELMKIRVKLHYQSDIRGMAITPEMPFEEFTGRVTGKFGKSVNGLSLKFTDEDGGKVSLQDDSDYDLAIETARESAKGKPEGKLEIWCTDA